MIYYAPDATRNEDYWNVNKQAKALKHSREEILVTTFGEFPPQLRRLWPAETCKYPFPIGKVCEYVMEVYLTDASTSTKEIILKIRVSLPALGFAKTM